MCEREQFVILTARRKWPLMLNMLGSVLVVSQKKNSSVASNKSATVSSISKVFLVSTIEAFKQELLEEFKKNMSDNTELRTSLSFLSDTVEKNNKLINDISNLEVHVRNLDKYSRNLFHIE